MKKKLIIGISLFATSVFSQSHQWTKSGSNSATSNDAGMAIAVDMNGNSYVTGYFYNTLTFGNQSVTSYGNKDIFLAKYDANGNCLWLKNAGGALDDQGQSVSVDAAGNCYITGFYYGNSNFGNIGLTSIGSKDIFIAKYDPAGNIQWANKAGSSLEDEGLGIVSSSQGEVYITGYFKGTSTFGNTSVTSSAQEDIFIAKYTTSGSLNSVVKASGDRTDRANGIALYGNDLYITGYFNSINCQFGNFTSNNTNSIGGSNEAFVAKYNASNLSSIWVQKSSSGGNESSNSISVDANNVYFTGVYSHGNPTFGSTTLNQYGAFGDVDIFVSKLNTNGNYIWTVRGGGSSVDDSKSISLTNSGNVYLTGSYGHYNGSGTFGTCSLPAHTNANTFIWKLDQNGNCMWISQSNNNSGISVGRAIATRNCDVYFSGYFSLTNNFGNTSPISTTAVSNFNVYLGKISENFTPLTIDLTSNNTFCAGSSINATGTVLSGVSNNYWWELIESDAQGNFIPNGYTWNNNWASGTPGSYTFPSNVIPPCNKYYVLKLAAGNYCQPWVEKTKVIFIACNPNGLTSINNICLGNSLTLCIDEIYEQPSTTYTVSWGKRGSNINCVNVTPTTSGQTTYAATITNTITGCVGQKQFIVNSYSAPNPNFSYLVNTSNSLYNTITATPNDLSGINTLGYEEKWKIEKLDANGNVLSNTELGNNPNPSCWQTQIVGYTNFNGYDNINNVTCSVTQGIFNKNTTYRITRYVRNAYCSQWQSYSPSIISPFRKKNDDLSEISNSSNNKLALALFPNPSNGLLNINLDNAIDSKYNIEVFDIYGKSIYKTEKLNTNGAEFKAEINLADLNLANGLYLINVSSNNQSSSQRIMIEK